MIKPDTIFVKSAANSHEEEAGVVLFMPRYPTIAGRLMGKLLHRSRHIRVRLDGIGSAAWRLIDGARSVHQIGDEMRSAFGDAAEPVYPRLVEFLGILYRNKFIKFSEQCEVNNVEQGRA